jgi:hypothetical protein
MAVAKRVKRSDWQTANVILDFQDQQVLKANVSGQAAVKDWDVVVGYYYKYYANVIERLFQENGHELPSKISTAT